MNKKFSTLLSGFLLMSAFASAQGDPAIDVRALEKVTFDKDVVTSGTYFIVQSADLTIDGNDVILSVEKDKNGGLTYGTPTISATTGDESDYVWTFEVKKDGTVSPNYYYALKNNEAGTYLTFSKASGDIVLIADDCGKAEDGTTNTSLFMQASDKASARWTNGSKLYAYGVDVNSKALSFTSGVELDTNGGNIYLCKYKTRNLDADEATAALFNDVKGGSGFNLKFSSGNSNGWANDILTDLNLKAFAVMADIQWGINDMFTIPAGIYFATEYPASLNNTNVITTQAQFEACTFLAVNPDKNYDIHQADRGNGIGFDLMTVSGADLNVYADQSDDRASVKGDVFVGNACFTIEVPDPLRAENAYNLKLANARVQTDASKNAHVDKEVYIGSILDQNKNYLVTNLEAGALSFETTNSTLYDVTKLLKSEDAPSIYTIQFVSELYKNDNINFAGEKNHYLTVGVDNNNAFALHSVEDYNAADPMFQFVITGVNKDEKTVTFANRQTKWPFTVSLYENEDGSFTVYDANAIAKDLYVEKFDWQDTHNGAIEFVNTTDGVNFYTLTSTKVVLTPVTVEDKFATFVNRSDNDGLVTFELARNVDDTPEFYVGARRNNGVIRQNVALAGYANSRNMTQFELEKVDRIPNNLVDEPFWISNPYVYKNGSRILTSTVEDTVAYYKYRIKVFEELDVNNNPYYVALDNNNNVVLTTNRQNADFFIIKENIDGSVSLIPSAAQGMPGNREFNLPGLDYLEVNNVWWNNGLQFDSVEDAWGVNDNYGLAPKLSVGLKTFMVEENPAVSYEAIPQHVSFEAVRGGFMTKDENSDARLSISTQAAEDLTFWLDTVHSDRNVPSFYILKNGAYMFNAADSAQYYQDRNNYRFNIDNTQNTAKLIFKTGELVTSDTLRTTVDGRSVLVAEEDNAPKGIKGGLENFQFQIIQAEAGSDEYVIRQGVQYVCQTNNYFYLDRNRDQALRFVIEKQAAPTANEGIEVSEVKVIAGNGQITIMGAAGKQVVVSNILGKVVASQTITSDNATIAVPAGIIAVAVEGEAAVKAIVK